MLQKPQFRLIQKLTPPTPAIQPAQMVTSSAQIAIPPTIIPVISILFAQIIALLAVPPAL
jgi:hypothetical protein